MKSLLILLLLSGCTPLLAKTGFDVFLMITGNKTTTDHIVSGVTGEDCSTVTLLDSMQYCNSEEAPEE